jgi:hypothetical protein
MKDSLAAAAAAAAADLSALASKTDASFARLRERSEGLAAQQKQAQEQQARLAGECSALQQVRWATEACGACGPVQLSLMAPCSHQPAAGLLQAGCEWVFACLKVALRLAQRQFGAGAASDAAVHTKSTCNCKDSTAAACSLLHLLHHVH